MAERKILSLDTYVMMSYANQAEKSVFFHFFTAVKLAGVLSCLVMRQRIN